MSEPAIGKFDVTHVEHSGEWGLFATSANRSHPEFYTGTENVFLWSLAPVLYSDETIVVTPSCLRLSPNVTRKLKDAIAFGSRDALVELREAALAAWREGFPQMEEASKRRLAAQDDFWAAERAVKKAIQKAVKKYAEIKL